MNIRHIIAILLVVLLPVFSLWARSQDAVVPPSRSVCEPAFAELDDHSGDNLFAVTQQEPLLLFSENRMTATVLRTCIEEVLNGKSLVAHADTTTPHAIDDGIWTPYLRRWYSHARAETGPPAAMHA